MKDQPVLSSCWSERWCVLTSEHHNKLCMFCCRYDEEGLPIYTTEELKVGAGGDTDKCPFDCECCF